MAPVHLHIEVTSAAVPKRPGGSSGDVVRVVRSPEWTTVVCCDGMGSGIVANVAARLHTARLLELEKAGISLRDAFARVVGTIHQSRGKNRMYAAVTVARILHSGEVTVLTYDMPAPLLVSGVHASVLPQRLFHADTALLGETHCQLSVREGLILVSDGITQAGLGTQFRNGWGSEALARHVEAVLTRGARQERLPAEICEKASQFWGARLGDDCTAVLARARPGKQLSILTGPPRAPEMDQEFIGRFLASPDPKVVCGATTAKIVARQLGTSLEANREYDSLIAPPSYRLDGIELVTEGAITLTQVYNILEEDPARYEEASSVTELCELMRGADCVHFFVGTAKNPANQSIAFQQKGILPRTRTVPLIRDRLTKAGKLVIVETA